MGEKLKLLSLTKHHQRAEDMLKEYESVFTDGLGTLKGHKANLKIKENCKPRFHKALKVPYALRPKVEAELRRLEEHGILF